MINGANSKPENTTFTVTLFECMKGGKDRLMGEVGGTIVDENGRSAIGLHCDCISEGVLRNLEA